MTKKRISKMSLPRWMPLSATALALVTALVYFAIGFGLVSADFQSPPAPVMLTAGAAYLIGGGLILVAGRRLMLTGAVINALVLILFAVSAIAGNATIDGLSLSGKTAQVALGIFLIYFVARMNEKTDRAKTPPPTLR